MVGQNCALYGCSTSRTHEGRSLFKIPVVGAADGEETTALKKTAREEWLRLLLRTRQVTADLKKRIEANNIFFCDLHFKPECIISHPKRKVLATGSVPTENLPTKSHEGETKKRRVLVRSSTDDEPSTSKGTSTSLKKGSLSLEKFWKRMQKDEVLGSWKVEHETNECELRLELLDGCHIIPKYTIIIDSGFTFTLFVYNWPIPDEHAIYQERARSVRPENIGELLRSIESAQICEGLPDLTEVKDIALDPVDDARIPGTIIRHSLPKLVTNNEAVFEVSVSFRSVACSLLQENNTNCDKPCKLCSGALNAIKKSSRKKSKSAALPAKSKAPLSACGKEKLRVTLEATRLENKQLHEQLKILQDKIEKDGVAISDKLETDLLKIMSGQNLEATPHMKFFWQQQMALLQSKKMGRRYHPQVIRFALSIHGKSPAAYRELRDSGALVLPSERVLRDYKNYFKPKAGINVENIECLREKTQSFSEVQRYVALVMDEMKIQSNLVFDKYSGDLIGFIDLGDPIVNFACVEEETLATHALAFLVRGMCTDLKHVISYYLTGDLTSFQLMPLFWQAVSVLELSLQLYVCAAVNDGASPNRKFFRLHVNLAKDLKCDVVYKTPNVFATSRFIYFFADSPHLMKTARNCLYNSGSGSRSRYMWNNGNYLLFSHIADLFYSDQEFALHTLPQLTLDHIVLTSYSKMKVKLATQVLSKSVMIALQESEKEEVVETAKFCGMMNDFFDCTNVRSTTEHIRKRNPFIRPYTSSEDERFSWLLEKFIKYLDDWKESVSTRPGEFSEDSRGKMFLSLQTYEGLKISAFSHVEAIKFLLEQGFQYVLSERFMQDVLEDYFGHQRSKGGRSDNPTAQQFGYNDLTIAAQRDIAPVIRGNVGGRYEKQKWYKVSDEPVHKRKKVTKQ